MNRELYQDIMKAIKHNQYFYFMIGGRGSARKHCCLKYICQLLEIYLGGKVFYTQFPDYVEISVHNDDIVYMRFTLFNNTLKYEKGHVIFSRMLEEYDAYMRYKYRDYEERGGR